MAGIVKITADWLGWAYHQVTGYKLDATKENLAWAIEQPPKELLNWRFEEEGASYTILEFAITCGNIKVATQLFNLNVDFESVYNVRGGSALHFFLYILKENTAPDLEMLNFLIEKISSNDLLDDIHGFTALEYAVWHMRDYKNIHWNVIKTLLSNEEASFLDGCNRSSLFMMLLDAHNHKIKQGTMNRTLEEEIAFLDNLVQYAVLEKKFHPSSNNFLTQDEFEFHTSHLMLLFEKAADALEYRNPCSGKIYGYSYGQEYDTVSEEEQAMLKLVNWQEVCRALTIYYKCYTTLVQNEPIEVCFADRPLASIAMGVMLPKAPQELIHLFREWGYIPEPPSHDSD
jgi:hypothetical protein